MNAIVSVKQSAHCVHDCEYLVGCKRTNDDNDNEAATTTAIAAYGDDKCAITRIDPMCTSHNRRKRKGTTQTSTNDLT